MTLIRQNAVNASYSTRSLFVLQTSYAYLCISYYLYLYLFRTHHLFIQNNVYVIDYILSRY